MHFVRNIWNLKICELYDDVVLLSQDLSPSSKQLAGLDFNFMKKSLYWFEERLSSTVCFCFLNESKIKMENSYAASTNRGYCHGHDYGYPLYSFSADPCEKSFLQFVIFLIFLRAYTCSCLLFFIFSHISLNLQHYLTRFLIKLKS